MVCASRGEVRWVAESITVRGIWGGMSEETAVSILTDVRRESPNLYRDAVAAAAGSLKMRPQVLRQQPVPRQVAAIRRTLAQVNQQDLGAQLLVEWLTKCQKPMLSQFLDDLGLEHEEGTLKAALGPEPEAEQLSAAVERLKGSFPNEHVRIYLSAFAMLTAGDWTGLPDMIA
jgi:hypothetical protein